MYKNIPNLLTMGNLVLGMLAIVNTMDGQHSTATSLVFIAMLLDGLDGRLAVRLKAGSDLGKQLDSFADLVSFGIAPSVLFYHIFLQQFPFWGVLVTLIFPLAGAYRLARFNLRKGREGVFQGLPITIAGGALASLGFHQNDLAGWPVVILTLFLTVLMVSRISYPSLKGRQQEISFPVFILFYAAVIAFIILLFSWREAIFYLLFLYVATGPLYFFCRLFARLWRRERILASLPWANRSQ